MKHTERKLNLQNERTNSKNALTAFHSSVPMWSVVILSRDQKNSEWWVATQKRWKHRGVSLEEFFASEKLQGEFPHLRLVEFEPFMTK